MYESSSSDESDHTDRFRNVRKLLVKSDESQRDADENYAYKQKLGDLKFDADFEGGNLGDVKQLNRYEYDLMVRPDVSNGRHSIWFNFTISNQRPNQCVILNFTNLSERLSLFNEVGLTPVARNRLEPNWVRLRKSQVFYYRAPTRDSRYQLSIAFRFTFHDNEHQFALFYPYTLTTLDNFITRWAVHLKRCELKLELERRKERRPKCHSTTPQVTSWDVNYRRRRARSTTPSRPDNQGGRSSSVNRPLSDTITNNNSTAHLKVNILTQSVLSKPIYELTVSSKANSTFRAGKSFVIIIGHLVGNFESVSSLVCQGLLDFMLSDDPLATLARDQINLIAFPMLDPDSIWVGNSRTDLMGQRTIDASIVDANQSLYQNYRLALARIKEICEADGNSVIIIELRANPDLIGSRVIGSLYSDSMRMEKHLQLPRLLSRFANGFYLEKCRFVEPRDNQSRSLFNMFNLG